MDDSRRGTSRFEGDEIDEFDLLLADDESAVAPAPARGLTGRMRAIQPPPAGPMRPARGGARLHGRIAPDWSRIAAALFVLLVVLAIVWFAVTSFVDHRRQAAFEDYFKSVNETMAQSTAQGEELQTILDEPNGGDRAQRVARIEQLGERTSSLIVEAEAIEAPEELATTHDWMLTTLEYRDRGVDQLEASLTTALGSQNVDAAAAAVADAMARLLASDVIWTESFAVSAKSVLEKQGIDGVSVPTSVFLGARDAVSSEGASTMLDRLRSAQPVDSKTGRPKVPKDGKVRGGQLEQGQVTIAPSGAPLLADGITKITSSDELVFEVPFTNQGEVQLTNVPISILITGDNSDPIRLGGMIDVVDPGETATGKVALDDVPTFGEILEMTVKVGPVPGEKTVDNNHATFQVQFTTP